MAVTVFTVMVWILSVLLGNVDEYRHCREGMDNIDR